MKRGNSLISGSKYLHPFTLRNSAEWIQSGRSYFKCLEELIDSAQFEIHIQTYIFASDETGSRISNALLKAAERKVEIFLLVDAYGSQALSREMIYKFKAAGIHFKKYGELYSRGNFHIGRRMHHKVCVFDGIVSVVGGVNIADHYNDQTDDPAWLDFAVVMRGDISRRLLYVCRKRWFGWQFSNRSTRKLLAGFNGIPKPAGSMPIRIRRNDFVRNKNEISITYREIFRRSENSILLVGGYFLPGGRTRRLIKHAISRGVEINVIVSEKSDVKIVLRARKYLYDWLIRNGIGVYEYRIANVHGKVIISDEKSTSIGSYDLNNLSTFSNIELNVDINDEAFSHSLAQHIKYIMNKHCIRITAENLYSKKAVFSRLGNWFSYRFVKTLFMLSVILAGKKEKEF